MGGLDTSNRTWPAFARDVIEAAVRGRPSDNAVAPADAPSDYGGVFVTLKKFGRLRGCMGILDGARPLPEAVRHAARTAALGDPRFQPVTPEELRDLHIEVSVLSKPWPMRSIDELEIGRHGIIVERGMRRGLFLPQVATEHHLDKEVFLARCCAEKAGLPPDAWRDPQTRVWLFTADIYSE